MDKKQCERMFEQMQPPEAVVQRLQQRLSAEYGNGDWLSSETR